MQHSARISETRKAGNRLALAALLALGASALGAGTAAAATAVRCGPHDCDYIHCDESGNRCYRVDRPHYLGERGRYDHAGYYGGDYRRDYDRNYRRDDRRRDGDDYARARWLHTVCDSGGDRCYRTHARWWNYREYYRRHGYRWEGRRHGEDYD